MRCIRSWLLVVACVATACANPEEVTPNRDAGPAPDASAVLDAGPPSDGGNADAGMGDSGVIDAGTPDAGSPDAGSPDAGSPDAGTPDTGAPDAGSPDAGSPDAGSPDSGCAVPARVGAFTAFTGPTPVAYYTFDDEHRIQTNILDEAPPAYDATPNAQAGLGGAGVVGQAVEFDGASALVTADPPKSSTFTASMWIRPHVWPANERKVIFNVGNGPGAWQGWGVSIRTTGRLVGFAEGGGSVVNEHVALTASCVNNNEWTHFAVTMDGSNLRAYQNGVLQSTTPTNLTTINFGTVGLVLGYHSYFTNAYYDGDVDELAIWDVALPETDIAEVYFAGRDGGHFICPSRCGDQTPPAVMIPTAGLVGWYRADRGVARDALGAVCAWCDQSPVTQHVTQVDPTRWPMSATGVDGEATLRFTTTDNLNRDGDMTITATAGRTYLAVFRPHALTPRISPVRQGRYGTLGTYVQIEANTFQSAGQRYGAYVTNNAYDSTFATSITSPALHDLRLSSMVVGTPALTALEYRVGGIVQTLTRTPGGLGNGNIEPFDANFFMLGASSVVATAGQDLSEVLIFDRPLTDAERNTVAAYLTARYGL